MQKDTNVGFDRYEDISIGRCLLYVTVLRRSGLQCNKDGNFMNKIMVSYPFGR